MNNNQLLQDTTFTPWGENGQIVNRALTYTYTITERRDISAMMKKMKKQKMPQIKIEVKMQSLPYPYFQQLLKFLKTIGKTESSTAISVDWFYDPKNFDMADKGRLMQSFCSHIHFTQCKSV